MREQELIGVRPGQVNSILTSPWNDRQERLVVRQPVSFPDAGGHKLHRHLRAIDHNILLSQLKPSQMADPKEILLSPDLLHCAYEGHPAHPAMICDSVGCLNNVKHSFFQAIDLAQ